MYRKRKPITEEEIAFVQANHQDMTVTKMSEELKVTHYRVEHIMKELGLKAKIKPVKDDVDWESGTWNDTLHRELFPNL